MPTDNTILKYIGARNLKLRATTPGERAAAHSVLQKLEANYPGIQTAVADYERAQKAKQQPSASPSAPNAPPRTVSGDSDDQSWDNFLSVAQSLFEGVSKVAGVAGRALIGRQLATHVQGSSKLLKSGGVFLGFKIPAHTLQNASNLDPMQMRVFRLGVHALLDEQLDRLFGGPS